MQHEIGIGFSTKGAKEPGIKPIKSSILLEALDSLQSTNELLSFIRSHYQGEFKTWDIKPITVTSYHSADSAAVNPPRNQLKISGSEYLHNTSEPVIYGLTVRMPVDSLNNFMQQLPEVKPMLGEWQSNRGQAAQFFALAVSAEAHVQKEIDDRIKSIYKESTKFSDTLKTLNFTVVIANHANDSKFTTNWIAYLTINTFYLLITNVLTARRPMTNTHPG